MISYIARMSWPGLIGTAGIMGMLTAGAGILAHRERERFVEKTPFLKESLELIKQPEVFELLGTEEPDISRPRLCGPFSKVDEHKVCLTVRLKGKKDKATLFLTATRESTEEKYKVSKLELKFDSIKNKKLVILD